MGRRRDLDICAPSQTLLETCNSSTRSRPASVNYTRAATAPPYRDDPAARGARRAVQAQYLDVCQWMTMYPARAQGAEASRARGADSPRRGLRRPRPLSTRNPANRNPRHEPPPRRRALSAHLPALASSRRARPTSCDAIAAPVQRP